MIVNNKTFKICVSASGETLDSDIDPRFGRCAYFIIIDIDNGKIADFQAIKNNGASQERGAGISAAEQIGELAVDLLITGEVGPKSDEILEQLAIRILKKSGLVRAAVSEYLQDGTIEIDEKISPSSSNIVETDILKDERVFIPLMEDKGEESAISLHFGHAPYFGLYELASGKLTIKANKLDHADSNKTPVDQVIEQVNPTMVYAQDMGGRAVGLFAEKNIVLKTGPYKTAKEVIANIDSLDNLTKSCDH